MTPIVGVALKLLTIALLGFVAVFLGSPLVTLLLKQVDSSTSPEPTVALRGGLWIGRLERLAIFAAMLAGFPEGLAIVLAVKGLARYPELRATSPGTAERFIIGTFASVLFASACAGLAGWLITLW